MTFIVEGPDGGGKTTLVKQLQAMTGFPIMPRRVSSDTQALVDIQSWVEADNRSVDSYRIYDRHALISEPIYGPILRLGQKSCFTDRLWMHYQLAELYTRQPLIIYCLPPLEAVIQNVSGDPDNAAVVDKIEGIYAAYVARAAIDDIKNHGHSMTFDYTLHTTATIKSMWHYYLTERVHNESR